MNRAERKIIENIIAIYPFIAGLSDRIEKEQEEVIADLVSPAKKVIERLIALDNRRIDLCNLSVLYGVMRDALGEKIDELKAAIACGESSELFYDALKAMSTVGYTIERASSEFDYLFKSLKTKKKKKGDNRLREYIMQPIITGSSAARASQVNK